MPLGTFWRRRVRRVGNDLFFRLEGEDVGIACRDDQACRRCKQPLDVSEAEVVVTATKAPPPHSIFHAARRYTVALYHRKCVPPHVFHRAGRVAPCAGSLPGGPSSTQVRPRPSGRHASVSTGSTIAEGVR